ncbi:UTRA domain-containing protein [Streptomyces zhihengii]|uniref:UTRA domain-containing protein n=1 Tax=Streptomyces zhihengii TaxID=1818004 RepID=UPI00362F4DAD
MEKKWSSTSLPYVLPASAGQADAWTRETSGERASQELTEVSEVVPPSAVTQALGLADDEKAVVRRRVIRRDGRAIELTDSYYPLAVATGTALAVKRKIKGGAPTLLASLGYEPGHVTEEIQVRSTTAAEREALELDHDEPVLILLRATTSRTQVPMEVSLMTMREGARLHYEIEVD